MRDKYPPYGLVQGTAQGVFGTLQHDLHRRRRGAISGYFSRQAIYQSQEIIHEKAELLCNLFDATHTSGESMNIRVALLAFSTDVYCAHALGETGEMQLLENWDEAVRWRESIVALLHWTPLVKQFPWIIPYAIELPLWVINCFSNELALVVEIYQVCILVAHRPIMFDHLPLVAT